MLGSDARPHPSPFAAALGVRRLLLGLGGLHGACAERARAPFAHALAGDAGYAALRTYRDAVGPSIPIVEVRTRWYDEVLTRATAGGIAQVVILAADMDARAYRLAWPPAVRVFEIDQPDVMAHKAAVLVGHTPRSARVAIAVDLGTDWPAALCGGGFDAGAR